MEKASISSISLYGKAIVLSSTYLLTSTVSLCSFATERVKQPNQIENPTPIASWTLIHGIERSQLS